MYARKLMTAMVDRMIAIIAAVRHIFRICVLGLPPQLGPRRTGLMTTSAISFSIAPQTLLRIYYILIFENVKIECFSSEESWLSLPTACAPGKPVAVHNAIRFRFLLQCIILGIFRRKKVPDERLAASSGTLRGASNVTRTHDLLITNQLLYRLSYTSLFTCLAFFSLDILAQQRQIVNRKNSEFTICISKIYVCHPLTLYTPK